MNQITLNTFLDYFIPIYKKELEILINKLNNSDSPSNDISDLEFKYHTENSGNIEHTKFTDKKMQSKHNYNTDNPTIYTDIKLISERTLLSTFYSCLEEKIDNDIIIENLMLLGGDKIILKFIQFLVLNSKDIRELLDPHIDNFNDVIKTAMDKINNQPYIEQKTKEWFEARKKMISASSCGYLDPKKCKSSVTKEEEQILDKSTILEKKSFNSWSIKPLRHGQQFEDVTGNMYDIVNNLISTEYGILSDIKYKNIGASPDGIITGLNNEYNNLLTKLKYGRMREIKNPVSRTINNNIPHVYYYQMQQQMYVCDLPYCDFIQTSMKYKDDCNLEIFKNDKMDKDFLLKNSSNWSEFKELFAPYILKSLRFDKLYTENKDLFLNNPIANLQNTLFSLLSSSWDEYSHYPLSNINKRGELKGILFSYTRDIDNNTDFKIEWLPLNKNYDNLIKNLDDYLVELNNKYSVDGYKLDETLYWTCENFKVIEVDYNYNFYESNFLPKLNEKWSLITKLKNIKSEYGLEKAKKEYIKHYPKSKKINI